MTFDLGSVLPDVDWYKDRYGVHNQGEGEGRASLHRGRRSIHWTLGPGTLHRNTFEIAWLEVEETEPFRGEPLRLHTQRRAGDTSSVRTWFTEPARKKLTELILPAIQRVGFSSIWEELHRRTFTDGAKVDESAALARLTASWYDAQAELHRQHGEGRTHLVAQPRTPVGERPFKITVLDRTYTYRRTTFVEPLARVMVDGEHVGWLTTDGELVPDLPLELT